MQDHSHSGMENRFVEKCWIWWKPACELCGNCAESA